MATEQEKIQQLLDRLNLLLDRQEAFQREVYAIRAEINRLKADGEEPAVSEKKVAAGFQAESRSVQSAEPIPQHPAPAVKTATFNPRLKADFEKFVGENLISKIGIAITVIGVGVGAKYAIDNELISPLTRIIFGYLVGLGLLGFAFKLKVKHENFSAVLLSGAMAIMYFITYAAYDFYGLLPQMLTFALMVVFTGFTVLAAIQYNRAVIAHIGLVGAYAVPFLLSDGSGKVAVLFSYMAIINVGILVVAFKKYWKSLYYAAFGLTWLIYLGWYATNYYGSEHFALAFTFLTIYFMIFYGTFLSYKLIRKEKYDKGDIVMLLLNSFIFYGTGYGLLDAHDTGKHFPGLFTLGNAIIHFGVGSLIYRMQKADRNLFYLVIGLVMLFITIAIPVHLDGNWVTLLWAGEAVLLFMVGRTRNIPNYEKLSYPLILLAFFSLLHDWTAYNSYDASETISPFLNIYLLTSLLVAGAYGYITYLHFRVKAAAMETNRLQRIMKFAIPSLFLLTLYLSFQVEIAFYWDKKFIDSSAEYSMRNFSLRHFKSIWLLSYTMLFAAALSFANLYKIKNTVLTYVSLILNTFLVLIFLTQGLFILSELRADHLHRVNEYHLTGIFYIGIRYIPIILAGGLMFAVYQHIRQELSKPDFRVAMDLFIGVAVLWVLSSELINWLDIAGFSQSYKLGLSILWGTYALLLIVKGIVRRKKHLRIGAIALFGVTLVKLFFYDIASLDTISKTIVLLSLGALLLLVSFLYSKYKHIISNEVEN